MTLWSPDTCGCEIEISDDEATRGQIMRHVKRCAIHEARGEDHNAVAEENRHKNRVVNDVMQTLPDRMVDDGNGRQRRERRFNWSFDENRAVVIDVTDDTVTQQERQGLDTALAASHGRAKVKVR